MGQPLCGFEKSSSYKTPADSAACGAVTVAVTTTVGVSTGDGAEAAAGTFVVRQPATLIIATKSIPGKNTRRIMAHFLPAVYRPRSGCRPSPPSCGRSGRRANDRPYL